MTPAAAGGSFLASLAFSSAAQTTLTNHKPRQPLTTEKRFMAGLMVASGSVGPLPSRRGQEITSRKVNHRRGWGRPAIDVMLTRRMPRGKEIPAGISDPWPVVSSQYNTRGSLSAIQWPLATDSWESAHVHHSADHDPATH